MKTIAGKILGFVIGVVIFFLISVPVVGLAFKYIDFICKLMGY